MYLPALCVTRQMREYKDISANVNSNMNISQIFKEAREDPTLFSTINTKELLESVDHDKHDYLANQTFDKISVDIFDSLVKLNTRKEYLPQILKKLSGYRYVDELHLLQRGKYIRWIRHDAPDKLIRGGVVIDIQFGDFGANILCRLITGEFMKFRFDKCNTYQKLTEEECMFLLTNDDIS